MYASELQRDKVSRLVTWGHWFAFFNGIIATLIAIRYVKLLGWPETLLAQGYAVITLVGHFAFVSFLGYLLLLFPITLLLPYSKILRGLAAVLATIAHTVLVYDILVFDHYRLHLNPFVFDLSFADLPQLISNAWLLILPAAMLALQLTLANGLWRRIERLSRKNLGGKVTTVMVALFLGSHLLHIWADANIYQPILKQDKMLPLHYPATARNFMAKQGIVDEDTYIERVQTAKPTDQLNYPVEPMQCSVEETPSIVMVTVEALRQNMINQQTMPKLMAWSQQAQVFTQHFSGSNEADQGIRSMLYGMLPSYESYLEADRKAPILTQELKKAGYNLQVLGFTQTQQGLKNAIALEQVNKLPEYHYETAAERDINTTQQALMALSMNSGPSFTLINYHAPSVYSTPVGFVGLPTVKPSEGYNEAQGVLFNQYRSSLNFLDTLLAKLLEQLPKDTVVIITGTHGQEFTSLNDHLTRNFSNATTQVPLMIRWPNGTQGKVNYQTSHYAIAPTLLTQVLGCTNSPEQYSFGDTLSAPSHSDYLVMANRRYFAIRTDNSITVIGRGGDYRVYDHHDNRIRKAKLNAPAMLSLMKENRRMFIK
ncbi:DUF3413 domain-containing protein [Ferrimonas aestuarii]|uniref:DUF3413 domain-containing protein n=1 Tax=Ferrimonas aestuarii TaxID=2569539 RepID=A0A4U1BLB2_9GAMM|nr:DUF3413 domain-containing protein [Ferrimonas aestuarii]TKB52759.1 DUF3413 domain-containing protein [Ferrimonas aestuarii]